MILKKVNTTVRAFMPIINVVVGIMTIFLLTEQTKAIKDSNSSENEKV